MTIKPEDLKKQDEEDDKPPRYVIRDAAFALSDKPPLKWVITNLIGDASVSMFYGEPGSKKTYSMLNLAACVALGKEWLELEVEQRKVLIIDEESGERRLSMRLAAAIRGELGDENIPIQFISLGGFKLDKSDDIEELERLILATGAGLVIFDALADFMDGDENSKQDCQPVFTNLRRIAEHTGAALIMIHHSNKQGGYRGSSAIKGSLDCMVKITSEDGQNWIMFKSEKMRDIGAIEFTAVATWTEDGQFYLSRRESTPKTWKPKPGEEYVLRYLSTHPDADMVSIKGGVDSCSERAANDGVFSLVRMNKVYRSNPDVPTGPGVYATYRLVEGVEVD